MSVYTRNKRCPCARCRAHGLMGAAIVITVGVLLLLDQNGIVQFHQSWPVLLLVIGAFTFMSHAASTENHIEPYVAPAPVYAPPPTWNATSPPPPPPAAPPQNDPEVKA
jgi:Domain of unknown function (DUF5668)